MFFVPAYKAHVQVITAQKTVHTWVRISDYETRKTPSIEARCSLPVDPRKAGHEEAAATSPTLHRTPQLIDGCILRRQ